jgi:hypothetical protein
VETTRSGTRPVVEHQLASHPRKRRGRRGLAGPGTPGEPLVGAGHRGPFGAVPALSAWLRILGSGAHGASHNTSPPVPRSRRGVALKLLLYPGGEYGGIG